MPAGSIFWVKKHANINRSEEHTSELQSLRHLVCRLLLEKKKLHLRPPVSCAPRPGCRPRRARPPGRGRALAGRRRPRRVPFIVSFFFFKDRGPPEIYPFPPHAPLPF